MDLVRKRGSMLRMPDSRRLQRGQENVGPGLQEASVGLLADSSPSHGPISMKFNIPRTASRGLALIL